MMNEPCSHLQKCRHQHYSRYPFHYYANDRQKEAIPTGVEEVFVVLDIHEFDALVAVAAQLKDFQTQLQAEAVDMNTEDILDQDKVEQPEGIRQDDFDGTETVMVAALDGQALAGVGTAVAESVVLMGVAVQSQEWGHEDSIVLLAVWGEIDSLQAVRFLFDVGDVEAALEHKLPEEAFRTFDSNLQPFADPLGKIEWDGGSDVLAAASQQHGTVIAGAVLRTVFAASIFCVHCTATTVD